jgi:tetratricopeptide (TPR) repeat protein
LFRGEPAVACDGWLAAAEGAPPGVGDFYLAPAALAAAYAGDEDRARSLLADAFACDGAAAPSLAAFAEYTAAELETGPHPDLAVEHYAEAIRLARTCGAAFVEGVASLGLVRLWAAQGRTAQALAGYRELLEAWRRSGHWTQLWTTLRNLAGPLAEAGRPREAALLLAAADAAPEAPLVTVAAVATELAELTGRLLAQLGGAEVDAIAARAAELSRGRVVDEALAGIGAALGDRPPDQAVIG